MVIFNGVADGQCFDLLMILYADDKRSSDPRSGLVRLIESSIKTGLKWDVAQNSVDVLSCLFPSSAFW